MRVLITTDTVGGVWTYAMELCRSMQSASVEFALATMGAPLSDSQRREAEHLGNVEVLESDYKLEWMKDPWEDVKRAGHWLLEVEDRFRPDVVHLNGYAHGALPFRAPIVAVAHSCVLSWWEAVKGGAAPATWDRYGREVAAGLHGADLIVAPSAAMGGALQKHYGPLPAVKVIHNARDASMYRPADKEGFILSAGRLWDEAKNVGALARVAKDLPWPVCVAGDEKGPQGSGVNGQSFENVLALGRLEPGTLAGWMARADVYALPARYEPFGLSALEAGLSGCALVLGDIPSLREVWQDAAVFVPPNNQGELRNALLDLIRRPARRAEMARRAIRRAAEFAPYRMADAYLSAYGQVLRRRAAIDRGAAAGESRIVPQAVGVRV